ncbi:MCE family protein [Actinomycetes bacterium M1A6_2h]
MTPSSTLRRQLLVISLIGVLAVAFAAVQYARVPEALGIGRFHVTVQLTDGAGLYANANVTYRGKEIGRVTELTSVPDGADAVVTLNSSAQLSTDVRAEVHSMSAVGEQYIDLVPSSDSAPYLADGSVITRDRTSVPQAVAPTIDQLSVALDSIGSSKLQRVLDESFAAVDGTGPQFAQLIESLNMLTAEAKSAQDPTKSLIDQLGPLLDTQVESGDAIRQWARSLAGVTGQLKTSDNDIRAVIDKGGPAADQVTGLFQDLRPTLPLLLSNLTSVEQVAAVYNPALEQILVLYPPLIAATQSSGLVNADDPGQNTFFAAQLNDPPPCTTGFLPASERRSPTETDTIPTPPGLYCQVPADDPSAVRGARNLPCIEFPGRRAATVQLCRNAGGEGGGDTGDGGTSGPIASTGTYDPTTGSYTAGDGQTYQDDSLRPGAPTGVDGLLVPPAP